MMSTNRLRIDQPENSHGKRYEKRVAKKIGARLTPNSGALPGAKGDMRYHRWLIESKSTKHATFQVELAHLVKITEEAQARSMDPALLFSFVFPDGRPVPNCPSEWVAIPLALWQELTER